MAHGILASRGSQEESSDFLSESRHSPIDYVILFSGASQQVVGRPTLVVHGDVFLPLTKSRNHITFGYVGCDISVVAELLLPDLPSRPLEGGHEVHLLPVAKATAGISSGGGIGGSLCSDSAQARFVGSPPMEMPVTSSAARQNQRDVEYAIGFTEGHAELEQGQYFTDFFLRSELLHELHGDAETTDSYGALSLSQRVIDGPRIHNLRLTRPV